MLRLTDSYSDAHFAPLRDVVAWFQTNDAAWMLPRQVTAPGVHAKWLNTHGPAVEALIGRPLGLARRHPARIHFTYLDPDHLADGRRRHDSASVGDTMDPAYIALRQDFSTKDVERSIVVRHVGGRFELASAESLDR